MPVVDFRVTLPGGETRVIEAADGQALMVALRDAGIGVAGTCGGMCSCGSCHVYVGEALAAALPAPGEDEQDMLDALADVGDVRPNSRLSCQIKVTQALENMQLEIAPEL